MKISARTKKIGLLGIVVAFIGLLGAIESIISDFGFVGIIVTVILSIALFIVCYWLLRPILIKNSRGVTMLEALNSVGLVDIENRDDKKHALPPAQFFDMAEREIAFSGISAYRTFDQNISEIKQALGNGRRIFVLILHPDSSAIQGISEKEKRDIRGDIMQTLATINREGFAKRSGFQVKFLEKLPQFTAVMADGDIAPIGEIPQDHNGQIRVQPTTTHNTHHGGIILQFKKKSEKPAGAFDHFADEFRHQWNVDSFADPKLFIQ
ncbi:MAG: hypothetical protein ABIF04_05495 [Chloroflexota bacterium]